MKGYLKKAGLVATCVAAVALSGCPTTSRIKELESEKAQLEAKLAEYEQIKKEKLYTPLKEILYEIAEDEECNNLAELTKKIEENIKAYQTTAEKIDENDESRQSIRQLLYVWAKKEQSRQNAVQLAKYTVENTGGSLKEYKQTVREKLQELVEKEGHDSLDELNLYFERDVRLLKFLYDLHHKNTKGQDKHWVATLLASSIARIEKQRYEILQMASAIAEE